MSAKIETERKFIIKMPSLEAIAAMPEYTKSEITQIYLDSPAGVTHRTRMRSFSDRTEYTETVKIRVSSMSAHEDERQIDEARYLELEKKLANGASPLHKVRHTFKLGGHTYEIDAYPAWKSTCILEVELESESEELGFPEVIELVREVTGDRRYSNAAMARCFPAEDQI